MTGSLRSFLGAAGILSIAACATQPTASLDDRYFEREAINYVRFEHDGRTVYCQNDKVAASLIPYKWCISETNLRELVENARRHRNAVTRGGPPYVATVPGSVGH